MQQTARVRKTNPDGTALLVLERESACAGDCRSCSGCGAPKEQLLFTAENPIGAKPGELVKVSSATGPVLAAAAVLYLMPVALFFLGYLAGALLWNAGAPVACAAFALGIAGAALYDRLVAKKKKTVYTIIGYGDLPPEFREKGDNNLD